ncbi:MAG TPA: hypothetical protein PLT00_11420 [Verrucomicrobiota bacterium]|jgi:hypothetical protein|nr:MAG: hypothetical protein BWX84_01845 [Verrucomicrobia bacterium ADurb.Bin118]HPY29173.1 hypothetical protein [Verrucomicrobiota bacterium]HQB17311.1 hypothetical protein [Verrucomicrobiota bacterium]
MKSAGTIFTVPRSSDGDKGKSGSRWRPPRPMISRRKKLSDAELGRQIRAGDIGTLVAVMYHNGSAVNGSLYTQHNHRGDILVS